MKRLLVVGCSMLFALAVVNASKDMVNINKDNDVVAQIGKGKGKGKAPPPPPVVTKG